MSDLNVNNDYTKMNNLTPFKLCVLQNFPFIEADFDAVTNYQLLCKVVEYLNNIIDNNNKQNTNIAHLEQNFITLYNYVKNYFKNLDVQEEINNKIDELITSGLFNIYLSGIYTPEMFGAKGDGLTDDTIAIKKALAFKNVNLSKKYLISEPLILQSNTHIFGGGTILLNVDFSDNYLNHYALYTTDTNNVEINDIEINSNSIGISFHGVNDVSISNLKLKTDKYAILIGDSISNESNNIDIRNILINNDVAIGSSDGVHINGGVKNINISNVNGTTGDDFIALNAIEGNRHIISNVKIDNIICSGYAGIRIYGKANNLIENVTITNCKINSDNGVRLTNIVAFTEISYGEPTFSNISFKNCQINSAVRPLFVSYIKADVKFYDCDLLTTSTNPVIGFFNGSLDCKLEFYKCNMKTNSNSYIQDCVLNPVPDNCNTNVIVKLNDMTIDKQLIIAFGAYYKEIEINKSVINKYLIGTTEQENVKLIILDSTINNTPYDGSASGYYEIRNCILKTSLLLSSLNGDESTAVFVKNIYLDNNIKGTFVNFKNGKSANKIINLEGCFQLSTAPQNEGTIIKRYASTGFDSIQIYKNGAWVAL